LISHPEPKHGLTLFRLYDYYQSSIIHFIYVALFKVLTVTLHLYTVDTATGSNSGFSVLLKGTSTRAGIEPPTAEPQSPQSHRCGSSQTLVHAFVLLGAKFVETEGETIGAAH